MALMAVTLAACLPLSAAADAVLPNLSALLGSVPDGSWVKVNVNAWSDTWTPVDLQVPPYSGDSKPGSILAAWSSFAWDVNRGALILWGGGHANYGGNEVYLWHGTTQMWTRGSVPSDVKPIAAFAYEAIDGAVHAPTSSHTYDNQLFLPRLDRFITFGGAAFDTGTAMQRQLADGTVRTTGPFLFDPAKADPNKVGGTTGSHVQRIAPHPEITGGNMWQNLDIYDGRFVAADLPASFVNCVSDSLLENGVDTIYIAGRVGGGVDQDLYRFRIPDLLDRSQDEWEHVGIGWWGVSNKGAGVFDPVRRAFIRTGSTNWLSYWDLSTPGPGNKDVLVMLPDAGQSFSEDYGMDRDPVSGDLVYWGGGGAVWRVRPPAMIAPTGWTVTKEPDPVGPVPSASTGTGVLGKWKYIRNLAAFIALEPTGDVWLYRPAGWTPPGGNLPPSVAITVPADGATFVAPASITVVAAASDPDGVVLRVDFYASGTPIGAATSAPWTIPWAGVAAGSYTLTAVATDDRGATRTSSAIGVTVTSGGGAVNVAAAGNGAVASASSSYAGFPASAVIDGDRKGIGWGNGGGWNDGSANAFPDWVQITFAGARTINEIDVFTLQDAYANPVAPTLAMTFALYGITDFEVQYWNGAAWADVTGGFVTGNSHVWRQFAFAPLTTDRIRVLVNGALASYSRVVEVEAWSGATANVPPAVALTAPAPGTTVVGPANFIVSANASDPDGIVARVDFFANGAPIGSDSTAPYGITWSNVAVGMYSLTAVAVDNLGAATTSAAVGVTVTTALNAPPTVSLTSPADGATAVAPATLTVSANAADSDGSVTRVDFFANGAPIGSGTSAPYAVSWSNVAAGSYTLTAVATDNAGATTTSAPIAFIVNAPGTSVNVAAAANGGVATASSTYAPNFAPAGAINGDRAGVNWESGGGWNDATPSAFPDWLQVNFATAKAINRIDVFTLQDNYQAPLPPTPTMTFTKYGLLAFDVQYWNGSAWFTVPGGAVTGNNLVWRSFSFATVTTDRVRVVVNSAPGYSRITEIEAWTP